MRLLTVYAVPAETTGGTRFTGLESMRMFADGMSEGLAEVYLVIGVIAAIVSYFPALCVYRLWCYGWSYTALTVCRLILQITALPFVIVAVVLAMFAAAHTLVAPMFALSERYTFWPTQADGEEPRFYLLQIHLGITVCMSIYSAALAGYDKWVAVVNGHIRSGRYVGRYQPLELGRVPEHLLHFFELTGGWPGSFVAQRLVRHKVSKESYQSEFKSCVLAHILFSLGLVCLSYGYTIPMYFLSAYFGLKCYAYLPEKENAGHDRDAEAS